MHQVPFNRDYQPFSLSLAPRLLIAAFLLAATNAGCWQEVRYEPTASNSASEATKPLIDEPAVLENPSSTNPPENVEPTAQRKTEQPEPSLQPPTTEPSQIVQPVKKAPVAVATEKPASEDEQEPFVQELDSKITRLAAWQMSSEWSMAAALQSKNKDVDVYGSHLEKAEDAAKELGVLLPELPVHAADTSRLPRNLNYLLDKAGPRLTGQVEKLHGNGHAALVELATKTHVLLLSYTPNSTQLGPVITAIRRAAQDSGLPENLWGNLVELLESRSNYKQVKAAIFKLHLQASSYLDEEASL